MMKAGGLSGQAMHGLCQAEILLTQGVHRILHASSALPGATNPLHEVLRLSEQQAMCTLDAVEAAQQEIQAIKASSGDGVDQRLCRVEFHLQTILNAQQSQDLAGQRLRGTIALLEAVESRLQDALSQLRCARFSEGPCSSTVGTTASMGARVESHVPPMSDPSPHYR